MSLSLSGVVNIIPLAFHGPADAAAIASPASPLYPDTLSWYLPASSLMENVEYSAEYHRPLRRWIWAQPHVTQGCKFPFRILNLVTRKHLIYSNLLTCLYVFREIQEKSSLNSLCPATSPRQHKHTIIFVVLSCRSFTLVYHFYIFYYGMK